MNDIARPNFDAMPIGQLREYASHLHIPLAKTAKKEEIKAAIVQKLNGRTASVIAQKGDKVPPGHALININEDSTPGAKNYPVYFNINGYQCTVPRGKDIIVPMRVLRALQDAKVKRRIQVEIPDEWGRNVFRESTVTVLSYPYQLLEVTPGPEPLTHLEKQKMKSHGPRQRYAEMFGHWPRPAELRRAIEKGLIKLQEEEVVIGHTSDAMIEEPEED